MRVLKPLHYFSLQPGSASTIEEKHEAESEKAISREPETEEAQCAEAEAEAVTGGEETSQSCWWEAGDGE